MSLQIPESDWKRFKIVRQKLLERFCERVLAEIVAVATSADGTAHERYLCAFRLLMQRDDELADAFNDFRRSTALTQLIIMQRMRLMEEQDREGFTAETQGALRRWAAIIQGETDEESEN